MSAVLFGKLPAHGDFVVRGLSGTARTAIDDWLTSSLIDARIAYGAEFDDRFDRALPWRCVGEGVAGAIAASQDSAGRRFPLLILASNPAAGCEMVETLLYSAITERWDADRLAEVSGTPPRSEPERWFGENGALTGAMPSELLREMLA